MGLTSKRKGAAGERELINLLQDYLGVRLSRNLDQARDGGWDLIGIPSLAIEVKRAAKANFSPWWMQTCEQADLKNKVPVLAYRLNNQRWRFKIALPDLFDGFKGQDRTLEMAIDFPVVAFCAIVREKFL